LCIYRVRLHLSQTFHLDAQVLDCPFLQPIGLLDYKVNSALHPSGVA